MWNWSHGNLNELIKHLYGRPKQWWQWNGWLIRTYDFFIQSPQCSMHFCKLIKLLHSNNHALYFHDDSFMNCCALASCQHALIALRWLAGAMRNVLFHLQNKEMVQRKKNLNWAGFRNWGVPAWIGGGPVEPCGWGLAMQLRKKGKWNSQWKQWTNTWARITFVSCGPDSVEVKHVSYFPSRPPPSLP